MKKSDRKRERERETITLTNVTEFLLLKKSKLTENYKTDFGNQ